MTDETVEAPPVRRNLTGWTVLYALISMMVAQQLQQYLSRPSGTHPYAEYEQLLEDAVKQRETRKVLHLPASKSDPMTDLDGPVSVLAGKRATDAEAEMVYTVIRFEEGKPLLTKDLDQLAHSKNKAYRTVAAIYGAPSLTLAEANRYAENLNGKRFLFKLIRAHALTIAGDPAARKGLVSVPKYRILQILVSVASLSGIVGLGAWVWFLGQTSSKRIVPVGFAARCDTLIEADRLALRCAQFFGVFLGVEFAGAIVVALLGRGNRALASIRGETLSELALMSLISASIFGLSKTKVLGTRLSLKDLGVSGENLGRKLLWGLGGAVATVPVVAVLFAVGLYATRGLPAPQHPITEQLIGTSDPIVAITLAVVASVLAPFVEELMFRGTMVPAMARVLNNPASAILLSGALFAMVHPTGIPVWPALAGVGAISGLLAYYTGSLVPSFVLHGAYNLSLVLLTLAYG